MRVILGVLVLLAFSSTNANASNFDFGGLLQSVVVTMLSDPEKAREDEHARQQQKILDEQNERARLEDILNEEMREAEEREWERKEEYRSTCYSIDKCAQWPTHRRVINGQLESESYICELDDPEGAERQVNLGYKVNWENFVYPSKQWLDAEQQCIQRVQDQREEDLELAKRERELVLKRAEDFERNRLRKMAETAKLPEPRIGMTKNQVRKGRWGNPVIVELSTDTKGSYEKWSYYFNKVLYFKNGKVIKIEQVRGGQ